MKLARRLRDVARRIKKRRVERTSDAPPEQPPSASNVGDSPSGSLSLDPWARAWLVFMERESELANAYKEHLTSLAADGDTSSRNSSQLAQSTVEQLLKQRESKQWSVSLLGKDVKVRAEAEKLVKILLWSDDVVKTALSAQPYAALAWSGISILLPLLTTSTAQHVALLRGFTSITHVQLYWKTWEDEPGNDLADTHRETRTKLVDLYSHILEYQARAVCHLSSSQSSRAWQQVAGKNDWQHQAAEVESRSKRCRELVGLSEDNQTRERWEIQLQEIHQSRTILEDIHAALQENAADVERHREDGIERDLLHALQADHEAYKNFNRARVDGTCEWFFGDERFLKWRDNTESSIIWVTAGPGCGKSVLARALVDERRLSTRPATTTVAHFFFKEGYEQRNGASDALAAILHQIFIQNSTSHLISQAAKAYRHYGKALANSFDGLWSILAECAKSPGAGEIICVLDALDECDVFDRQRIMNALGSFYSGAQVYSSQSSSCQSRLKFLVTSRPYDDLEMSFESLSPVGSYIRFDGDEKSEDIRREIDLVIDDWVTRRGKSFHYKQRQKIEERLKAMKNRTYLWLHLTFSVIEQSPSAYSKPSSIEDLLSNLPSGVLDAYEKILSRNQDAMRTKAVLHIVLAAAEPMTLDTINWALTLQEPGSAAYDAVEERLWPSTKFESIVKNLCGLFIGVHKGKVSFIHHTAREFLTMSPVPGRTWQGCSPNSAAHGTIALSCLRLSSEVRKRWREGLLDPLDKYRSFSEYAFTTWARHYHFSDEDDKKALFPYVREMCRVSEKRILALPFPYPECDRGTSYGSFYGGFPYLSRWMRMSIARWTDLTYASFLGVVEVVTAIITEEGVDIDSQGGPCGTALKTAAARGHWDVVRMLLGRGANANAPGGIYPTALGAAASEGHLDVLELLLAAGSGDQSMEEDAAIAAMENRHPQGNLLRLLLKKGIKVTEKVLVAAARNEEDGPSFVALLLKEKESHIVITERVLAAAAQNTKCGEQIMKLLLNQTGGQVEITEKVLLVAARNCARGCQIMNLLLTRRGSGLRITDQILVAAARNGREGGAILNLLLQQWGDELEITKEVIIAAALNPEMGDRALVLLFQKWGSVVDMTEKVDEAAVARWLGKLDWKVEERIKSSLSNEKLRLALYEAPFNWEDDDSEDDDSEDDDLEDDE